VVTEAGLIVLYKRPVMNLVWFDW